uniref:Uncharacterized protein n=1 Tax=Arundo donax TaxID=35708 RepID=A0A0A9GUN2_ARUDO
MRSRRRRTGTSSTPSGSSRVAGSGGPARTAARTSSAPDGRR